MESKTEEQRRSWKDLIISKAGASEFVEQKELYGILAGEAKETKLELARAAKQGQCFSGDFEENEAKLYSRLFHDWLRWVQSSGGQTSAWWHWATKEKIPSRDRYALELWNSMNEPGGPNAEARRQIEEKATAWTYYANYFFNWFLNRYDTISARAVYNKWWPSRYIHVLLAALVIGCVGWYFVGKAPLDHQWHMSLGAIVAAFIVCNGVAWINPLRFAESLMPRLTFAIVAGYLVLASAGGLLQTIYASSNRLSHTWLIAAGIVIVVYLYMVSVIQRHVQPRLRFLQAARRAFHLLLMAMAYSAIGLLLFAPVLFNSPVLDGDFLKENPPLSQTYLLITAAIAMAFGVVLQLVWQDKPVTEPL